jgi:uncharacterized repeat protein (TIGR01451 family)
MMIRMLTIAALGAASLATTVVAAPVTLTTTVMKEVVTRDAGGQVVTALARPLKITPGDHVVYILTYKNGGSKPASHVVVTNPIPADLEYAGSSDGPTPLVSVDNKTFAPLNQLKDVHGGVVTAATAADVIAVQWALVDPVPAGGQMRMTFRAKLK